MVDRPLTLRETDDTLNWVIHETRSVLAKAVQDDFKTMRGDAALPEWYKEYSVTFFPLATPDFKDASLRGYCGHAQAFANYTLQDIGLKPTPFLISSLREKTPWAHAALTVDIETTEGTKRYLLDPTFKQFCTDDEKCPGTLLANLPEGEDMQKDLLEKGFTELTPTRAASYLSAFCRGMCPFPSEKAVTDFFNNPPQALAGENKPISNKPWVPRSVFAQKGWVAKSPK